MASTVLNARINRVLVVKSCLPPVWTKHAVTMKAPRLLFLANTQTTIKRPVWLKVQSGQKAFEAIFLLVSSLSPKVILGPHISTEISRILASEEHLEAYSLKACHNTVKCRQHGLHSKQCANKAGTRQWSQKQLPLCCSLSKDYTANDRTSSVHKK